MKDDNGGIVLLVVLLGLALVGVVLWKKGMFQRLGAYLTPPPAGPTPPMGVPNGIGPTEYGPAAPGGGSAYGRICNTAYSTVGKGLSASPDPRAAAAGVATQTLGPLACAAQEYVAGKVWDGTKWVASNTGKGLKAAGEGIADAGRAVWGATFGKLF